MKTMTLDEVKKLPPLSKAEIEKAMSFKNIDFSDCPKQSKEDLAQFHPWQERNKNSAPKSETEPALIM